MAIIILHINHSGGTMENINENGSEIEEISELNDSTENMAEQQDTNVEYSKTETKKETKHASGLLKAGIALTLASSVFSLGASCYSILSRDDNNDSPSNESASNVSTDDVSIAISQDGYWVINGVKTNVKAAGSNGEDGENGTDGKTPHIGENGNWFIGETDTGIKAEGQNGENGTNGENGEDGTDGISVVNAEEISNDKWGIEKYIMFELSNGSYIATSPQKTINNGHYYEAQSEEDIKELVEYGVKKIQIAKDFTILRSMTFSADVEFDLNRKTLTYAASSPIVVENNCLMSFKNGSVVLRTQKAILVNGANSIVKFDEVSISANATVVESLGSNTNIVLKETTLSSETTGAVTFAARAASSESLFVFKGENAKIEVVDTKIVTKKTIIAAENTAQNISINIETSKIESTTAIMNIDTTAVKTDFVVDDNTMENTTAESLTVEPLTGGTFNFNPAEAHMTADGYDAYNVNGKWVVADSLNTLVTLIENGSTLVLNKDITLQTYLKVEKTLTINLNGFKIDRINSNQTIAVYEGGDLTIEGEGIIDGRGAVSGSIAIFAYGGNVTINGGTYTNVCESSDDHDDMIYASNGGHIVINDGTFICQTPAWTLNLYDGDRDISSITVYGGTFYGVDPANNAAEGKGTNFVADGYVVVERNGVYTLEESFEDAVNDASVSSISLTKDVELTETLNIDRNLTINLGAHEITSSVIAFNIVNGNVTIDNGTISASGNNHALYVNGTATGSDISLTLGDKLTVNSESCAIFIKGAGAKLVTSATLYSNGPFATISGNGNPGNEVNSISIVGGKVTHESYIAIYVPQTGSFNISGGEITGTTALYVKSGNLNISGGKLKATHEFTDYVYSGNGAQFYGDALVIDACGYPGGNPVVNITGGTFETTDSKAHGIAYYSYNGNTATINAAGYEVATHEIVLTEAQLHAAVANETIEHVTLGANITVTQYIKVYKKFTLNLGGKILSRNSANLQTICVFDGGDLTIEGEGTIKGFGAGSGSIAVWAYGGNVTINGGHYTNVGAGEGEHFDLIYASNGGHIVINNGTFEGQTPAWLLNMLDADRAISSITVNGGSFVGFNPGNNAVEGPETNFVTGNAVVVEKNGVFTVITTA